MKVKLLRRVFYAVCLIGIMAACNDDKYDGPSPYEVNATYTNQLSAGNKANLVLLYNGEMLIGKDVYFKLKDAYTGYLSLKQIVPGEQEINLDNIALTTDGNSYSFHGIATTTTGTSFTYTGKVEIGKLTLALSDINLTENLLKRKSFEIVKFGEVEYEYGKKYITRYHSALMLRMHLKTPFGKDQALLSILFPMINSLAVQLGGASLGIVLDKLQFNADGNIIADYANWPEGLDLMNAAEYQRPDDDYTVSPANLVTYYFTDAETMFVVPNIDQIIYIIEQNAIKQNRSLLDSEMQGFLKKLYAQLVTWSHYGIRFKAIPNPYTGDGYAPVYKFDKEGNRVEDPNKVEQYEGDYLLQIDTEQLAIVGTIMEALPYLAPDLCQTKLTDIPALADYASLIPSLFPGADTVGGLLTALKTLGDNIDFEIGLLLNSQAN